jgi:hypothetical protein
MDSNLAKAIIKKLTRFLRESLVLPIVSVLTGQLNLRRIIKDVTQFFSNGMHRLKMRNTIIHIPTKSGSDKVQGLIVVIIFHQLSRGCILKCHGDDICFLYDLPNGTTLAQEIVTSLVFLITEIIAIEDNEFMTPLSMSPLGCKAG